MSDGRVDLARCAETLVRIMQGWQRFVADPPPWVHGTARLIEALQQKLGPAAAALVTVLEPLAAAFEILVKERAKADLLSAAGWLPHRTSPFHLIDGSVMSSHDAGAIAEAYYRDQWAVVRTAFLEMMAAYDLDDEAKDTFREALDAHAQQLYRCTCRLLFPELERVARQDLLGVDLGNFTSLKEVRQQADELPLESLLPGGLATFALYEKLANHLYDPIRTEEQLAQARRDPVPNRHAAMHGLVRYNTMQSSINALIMSEYVFSLVSALKKVPELPSYSAV